MCGFLGAFDATPISKEDAALYRQKSCTLQHRGNTSRGEFIDDTAALFHYRLAFRDLKAGMQPLHSPDHKQSILFNGELYDFLPLRERLQKNYHFQTHTDTEVILATYLEDPITILNKIDGEYAFSIWDRSAEKLTLGRDVFGVKPLFFANTTLGEMPKDFFRHYQEKYEFRIHGRIFVSSEIKGIPLKPLWDRHGFERQFVGLYEEINTAFSNIIQVPAGSLLRAEKKNGEWHCVIERKIPKHRKKSLLNTDYSFEKSATTLRALVAKNVRNKLDAEVPLGAYLSGGIDSRIAAYEMSKIQEEIPCFTVGFEGADYDESASVAQFLKHFPNLKGHLLRTTNEALNYSYEHAVYHSELIQPYTNGCAKWWLSRFTRRYVRGVLTGDGADELFCGYPSYRYLAWWQFYARNPSAWRASLYAARTGGGDKKIWERGLSSREDGSDLLASQKILGWMHPLFSQYQGMGKYLHGAESDDWLASLAPEISSYTLSSETESSLTKWQNYFLHTNFPVHVLNWVGDRMEMANSLEGRPIYLSQEILDLVRSLPDAALVRGMRDKAILRKAYQKELGGFSLAPKKQFNAPFLQTSRLKEKYLSKEIIARAGLLDPKQIAFASRDAEENPSALERSFAQMFLQNAIVSHILHESLVEGNIPERNLSYEENFLDEHTELMGKS